MSDEALFLFLLAVFFVNSCFVAYLSYRSLWTIVMECNGRHWSEVDPSPAFEALGRQHLHR